MSQPSLGAKVVNPSGEVFTGNLDAQTYLVADSPVVQFFDDTADTLILGEPFAETFNFQPHFIEHFAPFRFVYLAPKPTPRE